MKAPDSSSSRPIYRRRWVVVLSTAIVALVLVGIVVQWVVASVIRSKLQAAVAEHLNARLDMESLTYGFPYTVRIRGATLKTDSENLIELGGLTLSLGELPLGGGPVIVDSLVIDRPTLRMVRDETGKLVGRDLLRKRSTTLPSSKKSTPLSALLRMRHATITGGQFVYTDRSDSQAVPMQWGNMQADLKLTPMSAGKYAFSFGATDAPMLDLAIAGDFDTDSADIRVTAMKLAAAVSPDDKTSRLPPEVQELIREWQIRGAVDVTAEATMPLRDADKCTLLAQVALRDATARNPRTGARLEELAMKVCITGGEVKAPTTNVIKTETSVEPTPLEGPAAPTTRPMFAVPLEVVSDANVPSPATQPATQPSGIQIWSRVRPRVSATQPSTQPTTDASTQPGATLPSIGSTLRKRIPKTALRVQVTDFIARTSVASLTLDRASASIDTRQHVWSLDELVGTLEASSGIARTSTRPARTRKVSGQLDFDIALAGVVNGRAASVEQYRIDLQSRGVDLLIPKFPRPLQNVSGTVETTADGLIVRQGVAIYGNDQWVLNKALLRFDNTLSWLRIDEVDARAMFTAPTMAYPNPLGEILIQLNPTGLYTIGGAALFNRNRKDEDFQLVITTGGGAVALGKPRVVVSDLSADIQVSPRSVVMPKATGTMYGGTVNANVVIGLKPTVEFSGSATARGVELRPLLVQLSGPASEPEQRAGGRGDVEVKFSGTGVTTAALLDGLKAEGRARAYDGQYFQVPILTNIASRVGVGEGMLTAGEGAARFKVADRRVTLSRAAINSTAIGLQGNGWIGFDGNVNLEIVAAPLGDWRRKLRGTGIPIVSNLIGDLAGGIQRMVNSATSQLLYQFQVGGSLRTPDIRTVPVPFLSDAGAKLFGKMLAPKKDETLLEGVEEVEKEGGK